MRSPRGPTVRVDVPRLRFGSRGSPVWGGRWPSRLRHLLFLLGPGGAGELRFLRSPGCAPSLPGTGMEAGMVGSANLLARTGCTASLRRGQPVRVSEQHERRFARRLLAGEEVAGAVGGRPGGLRLSSPPRRRPPGRWSWFPCGSCCPKTGKERRSDDGCHGGPDEGAGPAGH